jgi:hypothetical protein
MLYRIITFITIFLLFFSCVKDLNINISGGDNQYVVNATLCPDSAISLVLSKSKNILDETKNEFINNAIIYIYESNILIDTLKNSSNGLYLSNIKPSIGKPYTIKVEAGNAVLIEAADSIPERIAIQNIDTFVVNTNKSRLLNCALNISDPLEMSNYYLIKVFSSDKASSNDKHIQKLTCYDPMIMNVDVIDTLAGGSIIFFNDSKFNGKTHSVLISMVYPVNKIVYFQLWSISHSFFNYCHSIASNRTNNSSLFNEKTQIKSNIKGGLGIMGAYCISTDSISIN